MSPDHDRKAGPRPSAAEPSGNNPWRSRAVRPPFPPGARPRALVVGVVGGIGSGKSLLAAALARRGGRLISGDQLGHEALRQPEIRQQVVRHWGTHLLDEAGEIERRRLGAIVFADPAELRRLEALVHPWIAKRIEAEVEAARADPSVRLLVLDAAIMLEAGWEYVCDKILFVDTPREERLRRLSSQRGWTAQDLEAREAAQLPLTAKRARADHVVTNAASSEELESQIDPLLTAWGITPSVPPMSPLSRAEQGL